MAVSRTFPWWSSCTICAICVGAKCSYCPSSSRTRSHYHLHAVIISWIDYNWNALHCMHGFQLGSERGTQQKYAAWRSRNHGINMVSLFVLVIVFVTIKDKAISWSYCYCFDTSDRKSSQKYKILSVTKRARPAGGGKSLKAVWYVCIYVCMYACTYLSFYIH